MYSKKKLILMFVVFVLPLIFALGLWVTETNVTKVTDTLIGSSTSAATWDSTATFP